MSITLHVEKIFYNPLKFCLLVYLCSITRGKFSEKQKDRLTKSVQTFRKIPFHARFRLVPADLFLSFLAGNSFPR